MRPHGLVFSAGVPREGCIFCIYIYESGLYIVSIINGQLKAYINGTIGLFLVSQPRLSTTIGAVTRIPFSQAGVEGLEKEEGKQIHRTQELEKITLIYIVCTTRSEW